MVRAVGRFGRECEPYILPLFPLESEQMMGRDGDATLPANQSVHTTASHPVKQWDAQVPLSFDISIRSASIFAHPLKSAHSIKGSIPSRLNGHVSQPPPAQFLHFDICGRISGALRIID